jgi:hypothetical protein
VFSQAGGNLRLRAKLPLVPAILLLSALSASAATSGRVINLTTNMPASGDRVVLISLANQMREIEQTVTDAQGKFTLQSAADGPLLLRVTHDGVSYHAQPKPNDQEVSIGVYNAVPRLERLALDLDVQRYQVDGDFLLVSELIVLRNDASPGLTLANSRTFEISLPIDSKVTKAAVQNGNGRPVLTTAMSGETPGDYWFTFPIRPGETRLQMEYRLPYSGERVIAKKASLTTSNFAVVVPRSMTFEGLRTSAFHARETEMDAAVQMIQGLRKGSVVEFRITGSGSLPGLQRAMETETRASQTARPGGGLGPPETAPDPLYRVRWYVLSGFGAILTCGGIFVSWRPASRQSMRANRSSMNVDEVKDALLALKEAHRKGQISRSDFLKRRRILTAKEIELGSGSSTGQRCRRKSNSSRRT